MIKAKNLVTGKPYFSYRFYDFGKTPKIDTWIYIGKNLALPGYSSDKEEYFFQDPMSYTKHGILLAHIPEGVENNVIAIEEEDLFDFHDANSLIEELKEFIQEVSRFVVETE